MSYLLESELRGMYEDQYNLNDDVIFGVADNNIDDDMNTDSDIAMPKIFAFAPQKTFNSRR